MRRFIYWLVPTLATLVLWTIFNVISTTDGWFVELSAPAGDTRAFMDATVQEITTDHKGNAAFLLIHDSEIFDEFNISIGSPVNRDTIFGVSSLSKWVTAIGVMTLVEQGKLDLDEPVATYLTRWQLPESQFDNTGVTIRRLLSHTAGLTDGLGHNGFAPGEKVQPLVEHLTQALDADEGVSGKVIVGIEPGSEWKYSGGGYNLLQLIVEEVSGLAFESFMQSAVFDPLGMTRTGYRLPDDSGNIATYYDAIGQEKVYPRYTSLAATGLYTTTHDLFRFVTAHTPGKNGEPVGRGILTKETLELMRQPHASTMGIDIWGAGVMLFVDNNQDDFIIGHGGLSPDLNSTARINPATGNGIVMIETGNRALASDMATRWTLWEAGKPGMYLLRNLLPAMVTQVAIGYLVIILCSIFIAWRLGRR